MRNYSKQRFQQANIIAWTGFLLHTQTNPHWRGGNANISICYNRCGGSAVCFVLVGTEMLLAAIHLLLWIHHPFRFVPTKQTKLYEIGAWCLASPSGSLLHLIEPTLQQPGEARLPAVPIMTSRILTKEASRQLKLRWPVRWTSSGGLLINAAI